MKMNLDYQLTDRVYLELTFFSEQDFNEMKELLYKSVFETVCERDYFYSAPEIYISDVGFITFLDIKSAYQIFIHISEKTCSKEVKNVLKGFIANTITLMNEDL